MRERTEVLETPGKPVRPGFEPVMRTPAHQLHASLGARFERRDGWEIPAAYGPVEVERAVIRDGLTLADITPRGKVDLRGPVDEIRARLPVDSAARIVRLSSLWALILTRPGDLGAILAAAERAAGSSGMATDATSIYSGIALLGPKARDVLTRLTPTDVSTLDLGGASGLQVAKIPAIVVRWERALEMYVGSEYGRYFWRTVAAVVNRLGGRPVGWEALTAEGWT